LALAEALCEEGFSFLDPEDFKLVRFSAFPALTDFTELFFFVFASEREAAFDAVIAGFPKSIFSLHSSIANDALSENLFPDLINLKRF
jgi:hypothetical protein